MTTSTDDWKLDALTHDPHYQGEHRAVPFASSRRFFHYTCEHGRKSIGDIGLIRPLAAFDRRAARALAKTIHEWMSNVTWYTDLDGTAGAGSRLMLGLTSELLTCDRMRYRYIVEPESIPKLHRWVRVAHVIAPRADVELLNAAAGALPMHWWVALDEIRARVDLDYTRGW